MQRKPLLICIVGPTAIGKTSLSIKVANHFSSEIIYKREDFKQWLSSWKKTLGFEVELPLTSKTIMQANKE